MVRLVTVTVALALAGCGSVQANQPVGTYQRSEGVMQAAVGAQMVTSKSTVVTVAPLGLKSRTDGFRSEFVYLGLLGSDPAGRNTIRVRYEERKAANGVEGERPEYRAEVDLDLTRSRVIEFKGWRIEVLDATDSVIKYEVVGIPASPQ